MKYYVVNPENRKVLFGPFEGRAEADRRHYSICAFGISDPESGIASRPRCAVVVEGAITPNEHGNHFVNDEPAKVLVGVKEKQGVNS